MEVSFIKFNYIDMLNQYLTNIYVLRQNLYNLYFNIKELNTDTFKKNLLNDINLFNDIYLKLSLLIKKIGGYPIINFNEIENVSTIKLLSSKDYTLKYSNELLLNNYKLINQINNRVGEYAIKKFDLKSINLILEINKRLEERIQTLSYNA